MMDSWLPMSGLALLESTAVLIETGGPAQVVPLVWSCGCDEVTGRLLGEVTMAQYGGTIAVFRAVEDGGRGVSTGRDEEEGVAELVMEWLKSLAAMGLRRGMAVGGSETLWADVRDVL